MNTFFIFSARSWVKHIRLSLQLTDVNVTRYIVSYSIKDGF